MDVFKIAVPTGTKVGTLDNTILVSVSLYMGQGIRKKKLLLKFTVQKLLA